MLWWLAIAPLHAQEAPLDLEAACALVLRDGVDAREAALAEAAAQSTLARRRQAGLPTLEAGLAAGPDWSVDGVGASATASVSSRTIVWAGGTLAADREAARADVDAAAADREWVEQDLRLALASALLDLAAADAQVAASRATLAAEEAIARRIQSAVDAGARTRADALQQGAAAARARAALAAAERSAALSRLALVEVLRLDSSREWAFSPPRVGPARGADAEALVAEALERRPELRGLRSTLAAAEAQVRGARGGGLPSVTLDVGASTAVTHDAPLGEALADNAGASASVGVSVPLYARGTVRDDVRQASLTRDAAQLAWDAARQRVAVDVRSALVERSAARATLDASRAREEASRAAVGVVQDRYEAGAAVLAELLTARADLADAERARIAAEVEVVRSDFTLAWAVGGL